MERTNELAYPTRVFVATDGIVGPSVIVDQAFMKPPPVDARHSEILIDDNFYQLLAITLLSGLMKRSVTLLTVHQLHSNPNKGKIESVFDT